MRRRKPALFRTEAELCAAAIAKLRSWGWVVYPESCGFDFVAVRDGFQVGFEAKKVANLRVLVQATDSICRTNRLPNCIVVLVERSNADAERLCLRLGSVLVPWDGVLSRQTYSGAEIDTSTDFDRVVHAGATRLRSVVTNSAVLGNLRLPELVIDVPAGVPSPQTASAWKIRAVKMALRLRAGESVTRADLDAAGLTYSTFWNRGWIERANPGERMAAYRIGSKPREPLPDHSYPEIVAALDREAGQT